MITYTIGTDLKKYNLLKLYDNSHKVIQFDSCKVDDIDWDFTLEKLRNDLKKKIVSVKKPDYIKHLKEQLNNIENDLMDIYFDLYKLQS
jgi:hypothetical protein